jgi:hypothetical protein
LHLSWRKWQEAGEGCIIKNFIICTLHRILFEAITCGWMIWATHVEHVGGGNFIWSGTLKGRPVQSSENEIKMNLTEIGWRAVNWIHLAQNRDQLWAHTKTVMNLRVP